MESRRPAGIDRKTVDILYRVASLLSGSESEAVDLVEGACASSGHDVTGVTRQERLLRSLLTDASFHDEEPPTKSSLTSRIAKQVLKAHFPVAFAALEVDEQLVLLLHYHEQIEVRNAAMLLGLEPVAYQSRVDDATSRVVDLFVESLTSTERGLVLDEDVDEWIAPAIGQTVETFFSDPPDTLLERVHKVSIANSVQPAAARSNAQENGSRVDIRKTFAAGAVLVAVLLASLWWLTADTAKPGTPADLLALSASKAEEIALDLTGPSEQVAEEYVFDQTGRQIVVPRFSGAELRGASIESIAESIEVPVLSYLDENSDPQSLFAVFVYSYRRLNQEADGPRMASTVLRSLDNEISFTKAPSGTDTLLVWRHRTNIYVAVGAPSTIRSLDERTELQGPFGSR